MVDGILIDADLVVAVVLLRVSEVEEEAISRHVCKHDGLQLLLPSPPRDPLEHLLAQERHEDVDHAKSLVDASEEHQLRLLDGLSVSLLVDDDGFNEFDVVVAERIPPEVDATLSSLRYIVLAHDSVEGVNLSH